MSLHRLTLTQIQGGQSATEALGSADSGSFKARVLVG